MPSLGGKLGTEQLSLAVDHLAKEQRVSPVNATRDMQGTDAPGLQWPPRLQAQSDTRTQGQETSWQWMGPRERSWREKKATRAVVVDGKQGARLVHS